MLSRSRPAARRARGLRGRRLERDRPLHRVPRGPGRAHGGRGGGGAIGESRAITRRAFSARARAVGVLQGTRTYLLQDAAGNVLPTHSVSAGLDYPAIGPEHALLRDLGRVRVHAGVRRRGARRLPRAVGGRRHHPRAGVLARPGLGGARGRAASGQARPREPARPRRQGPGARSGRGEGRHEPSEHQRQQPLGAHRGIQPSRARGQRHPRGRDHRHRGRRQDRGQGRRLRAGPCRSSRTSSGPSPARVPR